MSAELETMSVREALANELSKCGANFIPYKRNPISGSLFLVGGKPDGTGIYVWATDKAKVEIRGISKKFKQVALTVSEPKREIVEQVAAYHYGSSYTTPPTFSPRTNLPKGTKSLLRNTKRDAQHSGHDSQRWTAEYVHTIPSSKIHLLMGIDEKKHFICILPRQPKSVEDAHNSLKPKEARKAGTKRVGEFFLVPATKQEVKKLLSAKRRNLYNKLEWDSNHRATVCLTNGNVRYVTGTISDARGESRHKSIFLDGWYKVVRNLEKVADVARGMQRNRYWD